MRATALVSLFALAAAVACGAGSSTGSGGGNETAGGHQEQFGDASGDNDKGLFTTSGSVNPDPKPQGGTGGTGGGPTQAGGTGGGPGSGTPNTCQDWLPEGTIRTGVADSNGMVAAARAREWLDVFDLAPLPAAIRLDDFFNYYQATKGTSSNATSGADMTIESVLRPRLIPNQYDLYVSIHAPGQPRSRSVLQIVLDTTPSMSGLPLERARYVLRALGKTLLKNDSVTVSTTDPAQGSQHFDIVDAVAQLAQAETLLEASNSADVAQSLHDAYARAETSFDAAANNRVLFLSDGAEPVDSLPTAEIAQAAGNGIFLVGVGVAPTTSYRERLLDEATIQGRGSYVFVDNEIEANHLFQDRYDELMGVAYDSIQVDVDLPWYFHRIQEPLTPGGGNVSAQPQYLAPGATLTLLLRLEACDASMVSTAAPVSITVSFEDPKTQADDSRSAVVTDILAEPTAPAPTLDKALAIKDYVSALQSLDAKRVARAQKSLARVPATDPDAVAISELLGVLQKLVQ